MKPISEYDRHRGDKIGHHWWIPSVTRTRALRHVEIDTNYWKSFVHDRLATAMGDPGCLSIFGRKAVQHRLFAEHLTAAYRVRTEGRGRTTGKWTLPAHRHDCIVGCASTASMQDVERIGAPCHGTGQNRPGQLGLVTVITPIPCPLCKFLCSRASLPRRRP